MAKKKRAPIEQLREAGRVAMDLLKQKGIYTPKSSINEILRNPKAPMLPGIPAYLPYPWTIKAAQEMMRQIIYVWKNSFEDNPSSSDKDDVVLFWKHVLKEISRQRTEHRKELLAIPENVKKMEKVVGQVPFISEVFSPLQKVETDSAMYKFMCDAFAIAKVQDRAHSVGEFLNWYMDWTQDLYELWVRPDERKNIKRV